MWHQPRPPCLRGLEPAFPFFFFIVSFELGNISDLQCCGFFPPTDSNFIHLLEKEMATHSSILAWRIPWTEEPGRLQSVGSQRVGYDWATFTYSLMYRHLYVPFMCFSHIVYCRVLTRVPHTMQWVLLDYFIIRSVYMNQLTSHPLFFLVTMFLFYVRLFLFGKDIIFIHF